MNRQEFRKLAEDRIIILDGATGSNLIKAGMPSGVCPEKWIIDNPDALIGLQRSYVEAGSNIVLAPTFTGNRIKLEEYELADRIVEINTRLVEISKEAVADKAFVAGDISMTGKSLSPVGDMAFEELVNVYKEQARILYEAGVDLFIIETMMSLQECRAALLAVKETCDLPVLVSLTYNEDGTTLYGTTPDIAVIVLQSMGADAVGLNCSRGPKELVPLVRKMAEYANVPIIVAINKMDKPGANPDKVLNELTEHDLVPEQWGGDVICVPVSAKTKEGLPDLLDTIILVADMMELKANPDRQAKGVVIEAKLDKGRGPVATFLVQKGTLHTGDIVVAGTSVGRVRVMTNENGMQLKEAGPSVPVEVMGLGEVPKSGDIFDAVTDEKLARELVEQRKNEEKQAIFDAQNKVSLDNLFETIAEGEKKELKIIVKADVQGSVEAVTQNLQKLTNEEVKVHVIHGAVGGITESDVMLANASDAIIVGFNVRPDAVASANAARDGVDIRTYRIIYDCIDEIKQAMKGMLAPKYRDVDIGRAEVRQTISISAIGTIAGCYVLDGKVTRDAKIRLVRDGIIITETSIASLRRFKDDVKEVVKGYECGIGLENYNDIKEGDIFEAYITEEYRD